MREKELLLHLSLIDKVGPATIEKLVQTFLSKRLDTQNNFSFLDIYNFKVKDLIYHAKLSERIAQLIVNSLANKKLLETELSLLEKHKFSYITILDSNYPFLLKSIHLPPTVLYIYGLNLQENNEACSQRLISIVGSRQADSYGYSVVKKLVPDLVKYDWTLVSGGALGIDTAVHKTCLDSGGKTIAVLGSGLLKPYPSVNKNLFEKIAQNGSVISPFSLNSSALPGNFPARNRIIAGLSKVCVIIQAAQSSGALITAQFALNEGREVCAVPGSIDNPLSIGCHKLISQGAHLITSSEDIRLICNPDDMPRNLLQTNLLQAAPLTDVALENQQMQLRTQEFTPQLTPETAGTNSIEQKILLYCQTAISFDELLIKTQSDPDSLREQLWDLQLTGAISQNFMGYWQKI